MSIPLESLPIPIGVIGGSGLSEVPRPNVSLTWPAKPPQQKHQPLPMPYQEIPHFTDRCNPALWLRKAGDVSENRLITVGGLCGAGPASHGRWQRLRGNFCGP